MQVPADDMPVTLSLHAAVGGGDGVEMHVGGIGGRWEHCISGDFFLEVHFLFTQAVFLRRNCVASISKITHRHAFHACTLTRLL